MEEGKKNVKRVETSVTCETCGNEVPLLKTLHREIVERIRQQQPASDDSDVEVIDVYEEDDISARSDLPSLKWTQ